jgi:hypothetical protein
MDRKRASDAEPLLREALRIVQGMSPDDHQLIAQIQSHLGGCLTMLGRYAEAEPLLVQSYPVLVAAYGEADRRPQQAVRYLVDLFTAEGKTAEAAQYMALVRPESPSGAVSPALIKPVE